MLLVGRQGLFLHVSLNSLLTLPGTLFSCCSPLFLVSVGWSFQGGLSGDTGGSRFGLGVDHVVQIEMVLPNGYHVKFGPTEWEDASAEGFIVPKTTGVTGLCRSNPDEQDEEEWIWGDCPDDFDVNFMDLWYAVRGGGGGTWGVVLSMHLQLHEPVPRITYEPSTSEECMATVFKDSPMGSPFSHPIAVEFMATYVMTPSVLNVTEVQSRACGCPNGQNMQICFGEENVSQAWTTFLEMKNITGGSDCLVITGEGDGLPSVSAPGTRFEGQIPDNPSPGLGPGGGAGLLIPKAWVEKVGVQSAMEKLGTFGGTTFTSFTPGYYSFASAAVTSDQANSLSQAHRDAGVMLLSSVTMDETFWRDIAPEIYDLEDPTNFPPLFGSNHASNGLTGPLKDDWTKPCPSDWTFEERLANCVSFQEAIYGTKTLRRLEAIKKVVDPNNMFRCDNCVGSNLEVEKDEAVPEPTVEDEGGNVEEPPTPDQEGDIAEKDDSVAITEDDVGSTSWYPRMSVIVIAMMIGTAVNIFIN